MQKDNLRAPHTDSDKQINSPRPISNRVNNWHAKSISSIFETLRSGELGVTQKEADRRITEVGRNTFPEGRTDSPIALFLGQFANPFIYILFAATVISFVLGHRTDAFFIFFVIVINTVVGFVQEYKAERSLEFLKKILTIKARVYRNGKEEEIDADLLVPGDVIVLSAGDKIPADARILLAQGLEVIESSLTGESLSARKEETTLPDDTVIADRGNILFAGTLVESGRARAIVTATGAQTEIGVIATSLKKTKEPLTPLQRSFAHFAKIVSIGVLVLIGILVAVGIWTEDSFSDVFVTSLALAVSAIPAGLPALVTVVLVVGMRRLLAHKSLVNKLNVAETLGSATVILTDKTGTITHGDMQVSHILTGKGELLSDGERFNKTVAHDSNDSDVAALKIALLTTDAIIENPGDELRKSIVRGNAVDRALLLAATQAGFEKNKAEGEYPLVAEVPFDSNLKLSAKVRSNGGQEILYVVGAPEAVIAKSSSLEINGRSHLLHSDEFKTLQEKADVLAKKGLRIVACAYRLLEAGTARANDTHSLVEKLIFVGFIALKDPIRAEVKGVILLTRQAGIRTIIATGDHKYTAIAVAEEIGFSLKEGEVLEGREIDALSDEDLARAMQTVKICARISPSNKMRIVEALRHNKEVVAMIGDGVNDAPALKVADIGVAVSSGTDIAKETADMVLLDGNFNTIVRAVEQGRIIFQNIKKTVIYLFADDFSEVFVLMGAIFLGMPLPLVAAQILWIDLIENGFPATALAFGKDKKGLMQQKPRGMSKSIFSRADKKWLVAIFLIGGTALFLTYYALLDITGDIDLTRTVVFALTAVDSLIFMLIVSSLHRPLFRKDLFSNRYLIGAIMLGAPMIAAAVYLPVLQKVLSTVALAPEHWLIIVAVSMVELLLLETTKRMFLRQAN
jgi:P-type Ca2+ transporter type 2C